MPGLNRLDYDNGYWPVNIESVLDAKILQFIEENLWLIPLSPRMSNYDVLENTNITHEGAGRLAAAAEKCWQAILSCDVDAWGAASSESFQAQIAMYPNMAPQEVLDSIALYKDKVKGYKITGAGGGGYLVLISDTPVENGLKIRIRRN